MPRILREERSAVAVWFEGTQIEAFAGDTVAAALLSAGITQFRTTAVSGVARGPLCLMGVCFDCLVDIDGMGNQQACMIEVREGMQITRQDGAFEAGIT